jgi:hypothetical protein
MTDIDTLPVLPTGGFGKAAALYRLRAGRLAYSNID